MSTYVHSLFLVYKKNSHIFQYFSQCQYIIWFYKNKKEKNNFLNIYIIIMITMPNKLQFNRIKKNDPESKIWRRSWDEQKTRNELYNLIKKERKELRNKNEHDKKIVFQNLAKHKSFCKQFIKKGWYNRQFIEKYWEEWDKTISIISTSLDHLESRGWLDDEVALKLIDYHEEAYLIYNICKFKNLNPRIARWLIMRWYPSFVKSYLELFHMDTTQYHYMLGECWNTDRSENSIYDNKYSLWATWISKYSLWFPKLRPIIIAKVSVSMVIMSR